MKRKLGPLETQLLAYVQMRRLRTLATGDLTGPLGISRKQERELFSRLSRSGMIAQVRRGLYLVPERLPLGGKWSPDEILALNTLMEDQEGRYQICGPNVFSRYGFDEQVPARVYAYNNRLSGDRRIGAVALTLIKVADERLGSAEEVRTPEGLKAVYSSRVRTLLDAVYDWSRFNSLPRAYDWIRGELSAKRITPADLVSVTLRYGDKGTIRRMGALLERQGVAGALLKKLERALPPSTSLIPWIPTYPKRGTVNRRWGVVINEQGWAVRYQRRENMKTLAEIMTDYAFSLRYDSIPKEVMSAARRHLADSMACALGAYHTAAAEKARSYALEQGGCAEATILGADRKVPAGLAALVNGTMVRYLDANDIYLFSRGGPSGHFSDGTPALLAVAEKYQRSGEELLTCLVASYEIQAALAESFNFWDCGLHAETNVAWVVPIVAARLMGATPKEAVHACGLSLATGTVLNTWLRPGHNVPMIKGVAVGLVLERALEAADLAGLGVTATEDALETVFSSLGPLSASAIDTTRIKKLGKRWTAARNMIKAYPAQLYTQAAIEAALHLHRGGIDADRIRKLTLYGHRNVCGGVQGSPQAFAPATQEAADHSTPYVMAMALLRGRLTSREYEGAPWERSEVKALMSKIKLVREAKRDRALDKEKILGVRLAAQLADGRVEEVVVHQPRGHPDAPLSDAELLEKMTSLLDGVAAADTAQRLLDLCNRLSTPDDVKELVEACRAG